jgi:hypothetical protein
VYRKGIPTLTFDRPIDFDVVAEIDLARQERSDIVEGVGGYNREFPE